MNRRTFALRSAAILAGTVALAGCTEETLKEAEARPPFVEERYDEGDVDLPVLEAVEVAEAGIDRWRDVEVDGVDAFETHLTDEGIAVDTLEEVEVAGEPTLSLEYRDGRSDERGVLYALGLVAGGYARLVRADYQAERLGALLLDADGGPFGHYEVDTDVAAAFNEGEITATEYARRVVDELETGDR